MPPDRKKEKLKPLVTHSGGWPGIWAREKPFGPETANQARSQSGKYEYQEGEKEELERTLTLGGLSNHEQTCVKIWERLDMVFVLLAGDLD